MLAGIIISLVVIAGLAFGLPWLTVHRDANPDPLDVDTSDRFSGSLRFVQPGPAGDRDVDTEVTTPLTRKAELNELRLLSRSAARRRRRSLLVLMLLTVGVGVTALLGYLPPWTLVVPVALLLLFAAFARVGVAAMRRRFDARARRVRSGWGDDEDTTAIRVDAPDDSSKELSVDLTAPVVTGALWDPIPVTAPTYVSKPLVPRTVRTIDLSAPVAGPQIIPTADRPGAGEGTQAVDGTRLRAVGE